MEEIVKRAEALFIELKEAHDKFVEVNNAGQDDTMAADYLYVKITELESVYEQLFAKAAKSKNKDGSVF